MVLRSAAGIAVSVPVARVEDVIGAVRRHHRPPDDASGISCAGAGLQVSAKFTGCAPTGPGGDPGHVWSSRRHPARVRRSLPARAAFSLPACRAAPGPLLLGLAAASAKVLPAPRGTCGPGPDGPAATTRTGRATAGYGPPPGGERHAAVPVPATRVELLVSGPAEPRLLEANVSPLCPVTRCNRNHPRSGGQPCLLNGSTGRCGHSTSGVSFLPKVACCWSVGEHELISISPFDGYSLELPSPDARALFVDDDVEQLHAVVVENLGPLDLRVIKNYSIVGRLQTCHQGDVSLYVVGYGADAEIGPVEVTDSYVINIPLAGNHSVVINRQEILSAPTISSPGQEVRVRKSASSTTLLIRITRDAMDKAMQDMVGEKPSTSVRFAPEIDTHNSEARQWIALARSVAGTADTSLLSCSPLAAAHFEQLLVHGLLGFQPHSRSEALADSAHPLTPLSLRRAMTFCDEHAGQPISVSDIAAVARVSVRTLQDNFRTYAQTTPLGYLRRVRLDRAHQDLLAAAQSGEQTTVTDVALRWGFVHLSRFAQLYRDTYGHVPSESLSIQRETNRTLSG